MALALSENTKRRVAALFKGDNELVAAEILINECGNNLPFCENNTPEQSERIRYAALKLSCGRIDLLREAVNLGKRDWRDLLMAADFGHSIVAHLEWNPEGGT